MNITQKFFLILLPCSLLALLCRPVFADQIELQRQEFLRLESLMRKGEYSHVKSRLAALKSYPLYPYLQYLLLKTNLHNDTEIQRYIQQYPKIRYSALLKKMWLKELIVRKQWWGFLRHYTADNNQAMQCLQQLALYHTGDKQQALKAAEEYWLAGKSQPNECDALFEKLQQSGKVTQDLIWKRFDLALQKSNLGLASYLLKKLNNKDRQTAEFWIKVHKTPSLIETDYWQRFYARKGMIFSHGIDRMARTDPQKAIKLWAIFKNSYAISAQRKLRIDTRLALALAYNRDPDAYQYLAALPDDQQKVREWRVRAALREQNWTHVEQALDHLSQEEKNDPHWQYWQARNAQQNNHSGQARLLFEKAAQDRSFYGFLAAEFNQQAYHFADQPIILKPGSIDALLETPNFAMVKEFRQLERNTEALRVWWHALKSLDKEQIKTAAKLANMWQWRHIAIFTVAKAKYWDDLKLRFPVLYESLVNYNAQKRSMNPAIVFGLIRQESVFNTQARSRAGARGLMQIMPATGKQIARELHERWTSSSHLHDPELNIRYGAYYYSKLLKQYHGQYALAAAAYNAGPHRVKRWRPEHGALPADIWVETIPFNETRKYVAKVLAYAMIYQHRTNGQGLTMQDFMMDVYPQQP